MTEPDEFDDARAAEVGLEVPEGDAVEQATPADPALAPEEVHRGLEVDEADALDQARAVPVDDEEQR